jgi:glycosyltransferase involved in cell wall biosynthesis
VNNTSAYDASSNLLVQPLFSIIICTYNRARLLPRALDSLLGQAGLAADEWEGIIVDDGSTDATPAIVEQYCRRDARFKAIRQSNAGVGAARDAGIQIASGVYCTFLDSDDWYKPHHLAERKRLLLARPDVQILHGGAEVIGSPFVADKNDPTRLIHLSECVMEGTMVLKRLDTLALGGFRALRYAEGSDLLHRAQKAGLVIATTQIPTYCYDRTTEDSLCTTSLQRPPIHQ